MSQEVLNSTSETSRLIQNMVRAATGAGAVAAALAGTDKLLRAGKSLSFKKKLPRMLNYAKSKHPELSQVSNEQLYSWATAIYSISPKIASHPETLADALYHIHQYGGRLDLSTLRLMSDIGGKDEGLMQAYIPIASRALK